MIHPTMKQAMAWFEPPPVRHTAPPCPSDMFRFDWDAGLSQDVICHLEFHEEDIGARENGTVLQLEPDSPQHITLHAAYVRGLDISALLLPEQVLEICDQAMKQIEIETEQDKEPT